MALNRVADGSLAPESRRPAGPAGPPRPARLLRRAAASLLLAAGLVCAAAPAAAQEAAEVPQTWSLNPSGLGVGDKFRLIFLTSGSGRRNAKSTDIADYNAFVQGRAKNGHRAIREFASKFRVVGSTETVAARDNTGTTGAGVEIHWLDGAKVADNYGDFYDGSWDDEGNPRGKDGNRVDLGAHGPCTLTAVSYPFVWTGSNRDGTSHSSRFLGGGTTDVSPVEAGRLSSGSATPLSGSNHNRSFSGCFYALSPVFTIVRAAGVSGVSIPSTPASGDSYGAGERVRVRLTFTEKVDVTGKPHVWLNVGGAARRADHVSGSGTKDLEFAYTVLAEDFDADGVRLCSSTTLNAGCGRVSLNGGTVAASSDGFAPGLDHPEQDDQSGDKVDGGSAGPASGVPTIAGTPRVGQVLMAGTAHIRDPDGLDSVSYEYQWIRVDRGLETDIADATASTYSLAAADAGKRIRVRVEFDDDAGNAESLTGAAYPAGSTVMAAAPAACAAPDLAGRRQIWTGTVTVEALSFAGTILGYGFSGSSVSPIGSLSDTTFDIGGNSYTIDRAVVSSSLGPLSISLTGSLAAGDAASLTLHVCGEDYALGDATHAAAEHSYTWPAASLDWSGVTTRTLYLSVADTVAPAGFAPPPPPMGAVPADWPLTPAEVEPGERFRLLFITTGKRDAESSDIADYNAFVQNAAKSGHASIRRHSSGFRAVASTPGVDARDNSATTGTGVKIFWLNGNKLADDYADFYDGDWDDEVNRTNENGSSESDKSVWTGSNNDGTETISRITGQPDRSRALGAPGGQNKSTNGALDSASGSPFSSGSTTTQSFNLPLYGLSQVFIAGGGGPDALEFASAPASGDTYARGETILIDATFTDAVSVRGMPTLDLEIGDRQVRARYRSGSGTARLRFAYILQAGELDEDGVRVAGHDTENLPFNLDGATIEAVEGGAAAGLTFAALDDDAGHKVDAQAARATGVSIPSAPADGTAYAAGETVTIALAMSEPVLVTGTPQVRLGVGGAVQLAAYVGPRGTATSELRFAYTVQAGDFDSDGLQICSHRAAGCGRIALDGGTVRAASDGTDADLRHPEQDADADDKVDAREVVPTFTPSPGSSDGSGEPSEVTVSPDWSLTPEDLGSGDKFRLLFVTSTTGSPAATDIADYNRFVQDRAAAGHAKIRALGSGFRVVGSTASVDARDNTHTTGSDTVKIYWLNGRRVANDYGDFYDGSWRNEGRPTNERGNSTSSREIWTGTDDDGTEEIGSDGHSRALGAENNLGLGDSDSVMCGHLSRSDGNPLNGRYYCRGNQALPFYALSQVFVLESVTITGREVRSSPAVGDTYRLDEPIEIALQFSEKVAVQGTPWLNLAIGSGRGRAEYVYGSGTDTLVFRHVVQAGDRDTNGFQVIGNDGIVLDGATIRSVENDADADTALPGSWIEGDKVDGSLVLTGGVCERTAQVRELIMDGIVPRSTQAGIGCSEVTLELLREATTGFRRFSIFLKDKGIVSLKAGDFEGFEAARIVELDGNRLTTLPAGLFDGLGEVTDLRLQDNALTSLQAVAFAGLDKLEKLDLSNNALGPGAIDKGAFEGLTRLSTLKLEGNPGSATFGPGADAGTGRTLSAGEVVTLDGKATGTGPWGSSNVGYEWTQTDGEDNEISPPTVTLSATDVLKPTFTVPVLNSGATVKLKLTVTVRGGLSASSTATFEILPLAVTDVSIVSIPQAADTYRAGETIEVAATFGDTVLVDTAGGRPTIRIDLTVNPVRAFRPASYARGSGTNRLVFAYTVQAADRDSDGLGVVEGTLALNGGTITSVNGAKALLLNAAVVASPSHKVDGGSAALTGGVCDRTPQIRDALVAKVSAASDCSEVTDAHLAAITGTLDLRPSETGSTMTGLKAGDFESLSGVTSLILTGNRLRDIPAGVFDEMTALTSLELNSNGTAADDGLTALPAGLFDKLTRLGQLDLSNNDLASLPPRLFEKLTALTRLVLGSNPGSARFLPLAKAGPGDGLDAAAGTEVTLGVAGAENGLDDPWGDNVKYTWTQPGGEEVDLSATDVARPTFTAPASADGTTLTFQLKVQGEGHGSSDDLHTATATVDVRVGAAPAVTGVEIASAPVAGSTYRPGETIEVAVTFSAPVAVDTAGGTPAVSLDLSPGDGDTSRSAGYDRGTGTNRLVFAYAVQAGDADSDGFDVTENGLAAGGGAIRGLDGATVLLAHAGVEGGDGHRIAGSLAALTGGICGRTPQVRAAILARAQANDETVETCADVTGIHLEGLTGTLDLDGLGSSNRIASLKAGDFAGLSGIVRLDLDNNRLRTVPAGVFDEMTALTGLSMSYNQTGAADSLMTLPAGLFDRLTGLTSLGLAHNDLKTLPAHIFEKLTALDSLALDGNPGSANFVPLAKAGPEGGLDAAAGATVTLGADEAEDGPGDPWGTNVTYLWTQVSGETVDLSASDAAQPTFTAPEPAEASELVFELAVTGRGATGSNAHRATRRLTVRVGAAPVGPAVTDVSIVSVPQAGDTYRAGEMIEVALTFDGTVLVDRAGGTPTIQLSANFEGVSGYVRGSGTNRLVFAYTVQAADMDDDGIGVLQSRLRLNGGTISAREEPGAEAQLLHSGVEASLSHKVDGGTPALDLALGVCDRTPQIRDALVAKVGADDCSEVSDTRLAAITGTLDLRASIIGSTMTGLKAGDFESLSGVTRLILSGNRLRDIPAGVFDEMTALTSLELNSNGTAADDGLTALPAGLFDKLTRLGLLDLSNNDLASLPPRLFEKLTALTGLVLGSNPGSASFLPLAKAGRGDGIDAAAGTEVELGVAGPNGRDGHDDPWGDNVTWAWTQTAGETVGDLSDVARPTFTAPASADGTTLTFQLKVQGKGYGSSDDLHTATATVDVRIGSAGMAPMLVSAAVKGKTLTLTYDKKLKDTNPTASVYLVAIVDGVDGLRLTRPTSVTASGDTVTMTLEEAVRRGQTVTLSYYPEDATAESRVQGEGGIEAPGFVTVAVRNEGPEAREVEFKGAAKTYKFKDAIEVLLTFTDDVAVRGMPYLELEVGAETHKAVYKSGTGSATLLFSYTVAEGDADRDGVAVVQDSLALGGGTIRSDDDDDADVILRNPTLSDADRRVDGVSPTAISARVAGLDLTVTFSERLDPDSAPAGAGGFAVAIDGGENPAVTAVSVSDRTVTLELSAPVLNGETREVTVSYAPPADPLRDTAGNAALATPGDGVAVTVPPDTQDPPTFLSAAVRGNVLTLTYDEPLEPGTPTPLSSDAVYEVVAVGGESVVDTTVTGIMVGVGTGANEVRLTLEDAVTHEHTVSISYYPALATPGSRVRDRAGREAEGFLGEDVENKTPEGPSVKGFAFSSAAQTYAIGDEIAVEATFSEAVTVNLAGGRPQVELDIGGATRQAAYKSGTGSETLLFAYRVAAGDEDADGVAVVRNSLVPNGGTIRTVADNVDVILYHPAKTGPAHKVDGKRPTVESAKAEGPTLTVTWSEALDGMSAPAGTGGFTVLIDGATGPAVTVTAIAIDGATTELTLKAAIAEGTQNVTLAYTPPSSGAKIRDAVGNDAGSFTGLTVTVKADKRAPEVDSATVDGATLAVKFDEPLAHSLPAPPGGFTVTVTRGGTYTVSALSLSSDGRVLSLTLSPAVGRGGDVVTLAYAKPSSNPLRDRAMPSTFKNEVADFTTGRDGVPGVVNNTPSVEAVDFLRAAQGYALDEAIEVVATFTEPVTVTGAPYVELEVGAKTREAVWKPGQAAGKVQVFVYTVADDDTDTDGIAIAANALAAPPGSILTQTGNREVQLGHDAVAADPARVVDTVLPEVDSASVAGQNLTVTWSEALDETSTPAGAGWFTVRIGTDDGPAVTAVAIDGATTELTLKAAIADGAPNVTLAYDPPSSGTKIRDEAGNPAKSFTGGAAFEVVVKADTVKPVVTGAEIAGKVLTLRFNELLDGNSLPTRGFRVTVRRGGNADDGHTVTGISLLPDGMVLELTLARAVASGDTVTLAYAPPSSNPLQDRAATPNKLAKFTTGRDGVPAVDNLTDAFELRLSPNPVTEGAGPVTLTVAVADDGKASAARSIAIERVGTATADEGADWTLGKTALLLPADRKAVGTVVRIVDDRSLEDTETVTFRAMSDGVEIGRATLEIKDNDRAVLRVANAPAAVEGEPLALVLRLDPAPDNAPGTYSGTDCFLDFDVTAELSAAGDTGALADPSALPSSHRFASDGTTCTREVTVELATKEPAGGWQRPRTFAFTLEPAAGTDGRVEAGAPAAATVTDDTPPPGPTVQSIAVTGSPKGGDTWRRGETVEFEVRLDKAVTVAGGKPELVLDIGGREQRASWKRKVGGTDVLRFAWTVAWGDVDADGLRVTAMEADRNGTSVRDAGPCTQNCVLVAGLPPQSDRAGHKVDGGAYTVKVTLPAVAVEGEPVKIVVLREDPGGQDRFDDALTVVLFIHEFVDGVIQLQPPRHRPLRTVYLPPGDKMKSVESVEGSVTVTPADDGEARADRRIRVRANIGNPVDGRYAMETRYERFFPVVDADAGKAAPVLSRQALEVPEGESRPYGVRLGSAPSGTVKLRILGAGADLTVTGLTFDQDNWDEFQLVTVTAPEDDDAVGRIVSLTHFVSEPGYVSRPATLAVTVVDDDMAALVLSKTDLSVTEQGPGGSFTVALASAPTAPVTVTVASPAESGLTIAGTPLTFHSDNWADGQTVTVTADDDADADDKVVTLTLTAAGAAEYAALGASEVRVRVTDDDAAGIGLSATALDVDEGGDATFTVRLTARPAGDVEVAVAWGSGTDLTVTGPDNADLGAAGAALVFTPDDWDAERTVTVTAGADPDTAPDTETLTLTASGPGYAAPEREVAVTVTDTDTPGLEVADAPVTVQEAGPGVAFRVRLETEPSALVTVTVTGHVGTDVEVHPELRRFTTDNWNAFQTFTVTAVDDPDADSDPVVTLSLAATGTAKYEALAPAEVEVAIEENDTQGLRLSATQLEVAEGGEATEFTVSLNTEPSGGFVEVTVARESGSDLTVTGPDGVDLGAGGVLTFAASNWKVPQIVTVAAGPDDDAADDIETLTLKAKGGDYGPTPAVDVAVTVDDPDTPALVLSTEALELQENSPAVSFTVKLASAPTAPVTVTVTGQAGTDLTVTGTALAFDADDWNEERTVTVAAGDDLDAAGDIVTLTLTPAGAAEYAALAAPEVAVTVADDDVPAIRLAPSSELEVPEDGMAVYEVSLTVPPTGAVTVKVTGMGTEVNAFAADGADERNLALDRMYLTFTDENWNVAQRVTVRDAFADEDAVTETVTLRHLAGQADGDGEYNGAPAELAVTVLDDDTAALEVADAPVAVQEDGPGVAFRVRLKTEPSATVTVTVTGHTGTDVEVAPETATFTTENWNTFQTFTVTAKDDTDALADPVVTLALAATGSAEYETLAPAGVAVAIEENDMPGLDVSATRLDVDEGGNARFTVRLNTKPSGDVEVSVEREAGSDLTVTGPGPGNADLGADGVLTFTETSWNSPQTVTVAAGPDDDAADDGETLRLKATGADYGDAPAVDVAVTVDDRDTPALVLSTRELALQENSPAVSFTVKLASAPTAPVTVTVTWGSGSDLTVTGPDNADLGAGGVLTFTAADWDEEQTVTVAAGDDADTADDIETLTLTPVGTGEYADLDASEVRVTVADDNVPGIRLSTAALDVDEGGNARFTVQLTEEPSGDVEVAVTWGSGSDLTVTGPDNVDLGAGGALSFAPSNWKVPQTVTVAAGRDEDAADDTETLTLTASGSGYAAAPREVAVTVLDDDTAALEVADAPVTVQEEGPGVAFRVRLKTEPAAMVTVTVTGHTGTDVEVAPEWRRFTTENWNAFQEFTVTAKDDDDADSDPPVTLSLAAAGAAEYAALAPAEVAVAIEENNTPSLMLSATRLGVAEGKSRSFTVRLNTRPSGPVAVRVKGVSESDLTVTGPGDVDLGAGGALSFAPSNWKVPQTVTVAAGRDEDAADDVETLTLTASGADYGNAPEEEITVTVDDGGTPGLELSENALRGLTVQEGGNPSQSFTVRLESVPTGTVTVLIAGEPGSALQAAPPALVFWDENWDLPQTVVVQAGDDGNSEHDETALLLTPRGAAEYAALDPARVAVSVEDDELAGIRLYPAKLAVDEGGRVHYGVSLTVKPTDDVPVRVSGMQGTDLTVTGPGGEDLASGATFAFTPGNWNKRQWVEVEAAADADTDDTVTLTMTAGGGYEAPPQSLLVTVRETPTAQAQLAAPSVTGVPSVSGPAADGAYAENERIEARVGFDAPVAVDTAGGTPTLGLALGGVRREASYESGSGTAELVFAHTVTAGDAGAGAAKAIASGLRLDGATVRGDGGVDAALGFGSAPGVTGVTVAEAPGGDGLWSPGEAASVTVTFAEPVAVDTAGGTPSIGVLLGGSVAKRAAYTGGTGTSALSFAYGLAAADSAVNAVLVPPNGLALDGGAIRSTAGLDAGLEHTGAGLAGLARRDPLPVLSVADARASEDGTLSFVVTLEPPASAPVTVAYATADGSATAGSDYTAASGTLGFKAGESGKTVTVTLATDSETEGSETLTLTLSAASGATIGDAEATGTVSDPAPPGLTARFDKVPEEHDGSSAFDLELRFSAAPRGLSYRTLSGGSFFDISNGTVTKAKRLARKDNSGWRITVEPASDADVAIGLPPAPPAADCAEAAVVCTADGARLSAGPATTVPGPASLSVADAAVREGPNATLDFAVTLSRARHEATTVDYATSDGTATAGADYSAASGTLTFEAGETGKTVSVAVLDDGHDEGSETMTFTLSNPAPAATAKLGDATATGTIDNSDAIPKAWIARFGRTVAEQVLEAVEGRMRATPAPGVEVALAGERIGGQAEPGSEAEREARREEEARREARRFAEWLRGETDPEEAERRSRAVTPRDLLTGSSFALTSETADKDLVSLWGRGAVSRFDGREDRLTLDGEVVTGMLGADWTRGSGAGSWTAGLIVSHSAGEGGYSGAAGAGDGAGTGASGRVEATLTGVFPWARHALTERIEAWGAAGYGQGELTVTPKRPGTDEDGAALRVDLDLRMAAAGLRGELLDPEAGSGLRLTGKTDAMVVQTASGRGRSAAPGSGSGAGSGNLAPARATVSRLRVGLEGSRPILFDGGATLTPSLEVGLRHDGGDAETGFGLDLGGGLALSDPGRGLEAELRGRGLVSHESKGFRERGFSGALSWRQKPESDRGATLTLTQTVGGSASGGADALLSRTTLDGLAANDNDDDDLKSRRLEIKLGYGFSVLGGRFASIPEIGMGLSDSGRDYRLGWRLKRDMRGDTGSLELSLEATRRESANDDARPEHGIGLRLTARW